MHEVIKPGEIITTKKPTPTKWRVLEVLSEFEHQSGKEDGEQGSPSYAALKLLCEDAKDSNIEALMRIYLQIPYTSTEFMESTTRATQATKFKPLELEAHQALSKDKRTSVCTPTLLGYDELQQGQSGLVPGGFLTYVVYEFIQGFPLADYSGHATAFWKLPSAQRDLVRKAFKETILGMIGNVRRVGYWPSYASPSNLVWQPNTQNL
ncbi:unnamed protein product [Penicillium nalgiovense]|uniref:Uncharacterized protein n=1 Tax=Penicillium nalgiovense TaxID=60175 RepID=A0A9W4IRN5_PENNA|nr:unnamed protein product [Penicillium nalgiovense]CAG7962289.1 unnamed protein product [Penicillium nalgiovense]CAG7968080.1 unnamed protein product [Penicillium nalgiovense]CAG8018979.1 unnamed protein product [Penicillium nalgiovense]CAG8038632.1 unnamed protein product [Penicillium nalgiovense]